MTLFACAPCIAVATIDGISLNEDRWCAYDLNVLLTDLEYRGSSLVMGGALGRRPFPEIPDETAYRLDMAFNGLVDEGGFEIGLEGADARCMEAIREFRSLVCGPPSPPGDGSRTLVVDVFEGPTYTGVATVSDLHRRDFGGGIWDGYLDIAINIPIEET